MSPSVQEQRDNLSIGIYLASHPYGSALDQILQLVLGHNPNASNPTNSVERYDRRFRSAQRVGRQQFKDRVPGYFTFNAMPFGTIYLYKATWYVWRNQQTGAVQTVPLVSGDLQAMRRLRDKDLATRSATTRSVRAADDIEEQRQAIQRGDYVALQAIHRQMLEDESLGEILSGLHGLPYADIESILPQLPNSTFGAMTLSFQPAAKRIHQLQRRLRQEQAIISRQLASWVMLQTGLPSNAPRLALQDAADRLARLP